MEGYVGLSTDVETGRVCFPLWLYCGFLCLIPTTRILFFHTQKTRGTHTPNANAQKGGAGIDEYLYGTNIHGRNENDHVWWKF